jgi:phenylalanyl-tRNA synthetase beta chain
MILTRSWLQEFIDLSEVSNEKLYETFNSIGLEVDSLRKVEIPQKVVVGKILSVEKHPDADKLNVCQIDVGEGVKQIVCGAKNVVDAEYVAVALVGAVLPDDFHIKPAKLRGVASDGMVCASSELGLPEMGKGIMILDESIGCLEVGREFGSYEKVADTIIELELTANRGDCLSIYGVARDLSAALDIEMKPFEYKTPEKMKLGIAREAELRQSGKMEADLHYKLLKSEALIAPFLLHLRLAMVGVESEGALETLLAYTTHATGVILRGYRADAFRTKEGRISVQPHAREKGIMEVRTPSELASIVGVNQSPQTLPDASTKEMLIEASYIHPDVLVEAVSQTDLVCDGLYYKTSRGSNPDLAFGLALFASLVNAYSTISCYEGSLDVTIEREKERVVVDAKTLSDIVGMPVELNRIVTILQKLGFGISAMGSECIAAVVPLFRHDIKNIQDITEEIVRIIGIQNIEAKPSVFAEKPRLNATTQRYQAKKGLKHRAIARGFYENLSYVFSDKKLLEAYGFAVTREDLALANPIAEELNTLRSTILINLLNAAKRNVSYSQKSIPLFEIGAVFDEVRNQKEVLSFLFSGQVSSESVENAGKPAMVDFSHFVEKLSGVLGAFTLENTEAKNGLMHPYQSANILIDGVVCGYVSKLHPTVQEAFDLPVTFIAEVDFEALLPKHIQATPISKFQGVYKDLSVVIDKEMPYARVREALEGVSLQMLKRFYPVDIYEDEALGEKKSLTLRFFIQSMEATLSEGDIETVMESVMQTLQTECQATLR